MAGKILRRILQDWLQLVAEKVLPESQHGFQKGWGCLDMISAARQLVEKTREHNDPYLFCSSISERLMTQCQEKHCGAYYKSTCVWCAPKNGVIGQVFSQGYDCYGEGWR